MSFKITARTILQLGSELISSDAIAFYELIKNAFDARSKKVEVRVVVRVQQVISDEIFLLYENEQDKAVKSYTLQDFKDKISTNLIFDAYEVDKFKTRILSTDSVDEFLKVLKKANYILIKDWGDGMSFDDIEDIYLTIGTRNRRKDRTNLSALERPILGEKGIGRLSVMRLGDGLRVETTQSQEKNVNILEIDWSIFSHDSDALLESILITPTLGKEKSNIEEKGTKIYIYDLRTEWTYDKLRLISQEQLSRFIDPYGTKNRDFITVWFNKQPIILQGIDKILFKYAHAVIKARLIFDSENNPIFCGEIDYKTYDRQKTFSVEGTHLSSIVNSPKFISLLRDLGQFETEFYWYNRKLLTVNEGVLEAPYIKKLVALWGGGLMVYRDGFRVNPYGGPNDDWLSLDKKALASGGYKLNRRQIVGKVDISSSLNPNLLDQTNREGLRDNSEKNILIVLLQYLIWKELKPYLDDIKEIEDKNLAAMSLNEIENRIVAGQNQVREAVELLKDKYPAINDETEALATIEDVLQESAALFKVAKASSIALEDRLKTTIDLAGLGLMVDVIAHELNRSTDHAMKTIASLSERVPADLSSTMETLKIQLKTLQKRLKVIDPLGPSGRQQKVLTDLHELIMETIDSHDSQFERHSIEVKIVDESPNKEWKLKVVPGMIVQIVENLINNSVYWIKQEQNIDKDFKAEIIIVINSEKEIITYSDNGPGIPKSKKEDVFRPFFSTKPPGDGKGLGLYISREVAKYHNAEFFLLDDNSSNLNTFVLNLKNS